jgi:hypothetical protein
MAEELKELIICPYCNYEYEESREYYDSDDEELECPECGKIFRLSVEHNVRYSSYRIDCKDDIHDFEDAEGLIYDQDICDDYNKEKFLGRTGWRPHLTWRRKCKNCEKVEFKDTLIGAENPFV